MIHVHVTNGITSTTHCTYACMAFPIPASSFVLFGFGFPYVHRLCSMNNGVSLQFTVFYGCRSHERQDERVLRFDEGMLN